VRALGALILARLHFRKDDCHRTGWWRLLESIRHVPVRHQNPSLMIGHESKVPDADQPLRQHVHKNRRMNSSAERVILRFLLP